MVPVQINVKVAVYLDL